MSLRPRVIVNQRLQRFDVAGVSFPCDNLPGDVADNGVAAPLLAGVDVGEVHLDRGDSHSLYGVSEGVAVMGERTGVDDDALAVLAFLVDLVDEGTFVI